MGRIDNLEIQSTTTWATAIYTDDDEETYDIVFARTSAENVGFAWVELLQVEQDGQSLDLNDSLCERIEEHLKRQSIETEYAQP